MAAITQLPTFEASGQEFTIQPDGRITNEAGQIALKHRQPVQMLELSKYVFVVRANIALAWIEPINVEELLHRRAGCCGGKAQKYSPANESDVRRWTNGGGR